MRAPRHPDGFVASPEAGPLAPPRQRSFDDMAAPLSDVTFCAVDLETTGASPKTCEIVEIGAVKSRGGEVLGTFQTFVRPQQDLPVEIQLLTGIRPSMLAGAEPLPAVLPAWLEFLGDAVFVAHNARFDHGFLRRACELLDYEAPSPVVLDTARLARRLLRGDVPNCRLSTLAAFFRTTRQPCHRALPDAAACLDVLHGLIERASAYGVVTLAELVALQKASSNPHLEKVRLARTVPRGRGVYLFRNARGETIYVGKATDLRSRVRSYFVSDERKRIGDLLAEISTVRTIPCATDLEAQALEARLIERLAPRYNRRGVTRRAPAYLKLTLGERHPRFSVVKAVKDDRSLYVGPFPSRSRARAAGATLAGLFGVRTCTLRLRDGDSAEPCPLYDLGSCRGPCTGRPEDVAAHDDAVEHLRSDLCSGLRAARDAVAAKLSRLAAERRYEEAAAHRDAFAEVVRTVDRARMLAAIAWSGRIELQAAEGRVVLRDGRLGAADDLPNRSGGRPGDHPLALSTEGLEERKVVAAWLERAQDLRLVDADRPPASPWPRTAHLVRIDIE